MSAYRVIAVAIGMVNVSPGQNIFVKTRTHQDLDLLHPQTYQHQVTGNQLTQIEMSYQ
jgi:hypothetical protein